MSDNTPVYEPGDYCEICLGVERLGTATFPGDAQFTICESCHSDEPKFKEWFVRELEEFLNESPDYVKTDDDKWAYIGDDTQVRSELAQRRQPWANTN